MLCSEYDAHLILSAVKPRHGKITVISNNMECYTSFPINDVTFIDPCQFMLSSLDKLSSSFSKDQFRETSNITFNNQINHISITWQRVEKRVKSHMSMKTIETTLTNRQRQINNDKLKETWH